MMESPWDSVLSSQSSSAGNSTPTTPGSELGNDSAPYVTLGPEVKGSFILVIGGLGFIGSHTALELLKAGYNVAIVDDLSNSFGNVFTKVQKLAAEHFHMLRREMPVVNFHYLDYRSQSMRLLLESYSRLTPLPSDGSGQPPSLVRQSRISGVIHFAAYKSVPESISKPITYYQNNVSGLVDLIELLGRCGIRNFVFSSSATVYGTKADSRQPLQEEDLVHHTETYDSSNETLVAEPLVSGLQSPYARTKYFCEAILADVAKSDPSWRIVVLRYFNPIGCDPSGLLGEDPRNTPTNLFPVLTQVLTGVRDTAEIFGTDWETRDGTAVRDFIHVSDVARGHIAALASSREWPFRTYNLGSGTGTTVIEAVRSLEQAAGQAIPIRWTGRRPGDVGTCVASNERVLRELGWVAKENIPKGAIDLWNYVTKARLAGQ